MRFLVDTPVLLWAVQAPEKLSDQAGRIIRNQHDQLFISVATPWELAIKAKAGRLDVAELLNDFEHAVAAAGYLFLDTRVTHVILACSLPLHHKDPFDRLLIAQALDLRIPVISRDERFDAYGVKRVWD